MHKRNPAAPGRHSTSPEATDSAFDEGGNWMTSEAARKALRVGTCELMHLRVAGELRFKKQGNAFLYSPADVERLRSKKFRSR